MHEYDSNFIDDIYQTITEQPLTDKAADLQSSPITSRVDVANYGISLVTPSDETTPLLSEETEAIAHPLSERKLLLTSRGTYVLMKEQGNDYVEPLNGKIIYNDIRRELIQRGSTCRPHEVQEVVDTLDAKAFMDGNHAEIYYRVAPYLGPECKGSQRAIEVDLGHSNHMRVRIVPGEVKFIRSGSDMLFFRTPITRPMATPASHGNLDLLRRHVNLSDSDYILLVAWISYTLAHPKVKTSKFLLLVLMGDQGSGKSALASNIIQPLIDPTSLQLQIFPQQPKDLALTLQYTHAPAFDNMRTINSTMSDMLCIACTGGTISARTLYTDAGLSLQKVHGPAILNGISSLLEHPDLAQRCLPVRTLPIPESQRRSELEITRDLESELPAIQKGIFDLIASVLLHLDTVQILRPERMIDFSRWLAAMEVVNGVAPSTYQDAYSEVLNQAQLDSLMEHSLADAVIQFLVRRSGKAWSGTPAQLLSELNDLTPKPTQYSSDWPKNAISLSKKLASLKASFLTQGIAIDSTRGKQRRITIKNTTDDLKPAVMVNDDDY